MRGNFMTWASRGLLVAGLTAVGGCAHSYGLVPVTTATWTAGPGLAARGQVAGVKVVVSADAWKGNPARLSQRVLPLRVSIVNHSGRTLMLRYRDFDVDGPAGSGVRLRAIPPFHLHGSVVVGETQVTPGFAADGFWPAPYYGPMYLGLQPYWEPWDFDDGYYRTYTVAWREHLPTHDMIAKALPEGVVAVDGHVDGFIYFQRLKQNVPEVSFRLTLIDAQTRQPFGEIDVPFRVQRQ